MDPDLFESLAFGDGGMGRISAVGAAAREGHVT